LLRIIKHFDIQYDPNMIVRGAGRGCSGVLGEFVIIVLATTTRQTSVGVHVAPFSFLVVAGNIRTWMAPGVNVNAKIS
jgi:hypothetical protein